MARQKVHTSQADSCHTSPTSPASIHNKNATPLHPYLITHPTTHTTNTPGKVFQNIFYNIDFQCIKFLHHIKSFPKVIILKIFYPQKLPIK